MDVPVSLDLIYSRQKWLEETINCFYGIVHIPVPSIVSKECKTVERFRIYEFTKRWDPYGHRHYFEEIGEKRWYDTLEEAVMQLSLMIPEDIPIFELIPGSNLDKKWFVTAHICYPCEVVGYFRALRCGW